MLTLSARLQGRLRELAALAYPQECCGLLCGRAEPGRTRVGSIWPVPNRHPEPVKGFCIGPLDFARATFGARRRSEQVVGIYHSHPDGPAAPSSWDRAAALPEFSYLILGTDRLASFRLQDGQLRPEAVERV